jgi:hypothetical protein
VLSGRPARVDGVLGVELFVGLGDEFEPPPAPDGIPVKVTVESELLELLGPPDSTPVLYVDRDTWPQQYLEEFEELKAMRAAAERLGSFHGVERMIDAYGVFFDIVVEKEHQDKVHELLRQFPDVRFRVYPVELQSDGRLRHVAPVDDMTIEQLIERIDQWRGEQT